MDKHTKDSPATLLVCPAHDRRQRLRNLRALYLCTHPTCQHSYRLSCLRCRNQFHRQHSVRFISIEELKSYWSSLLTNTDRRLSKLSTLFKEMHSKMLQLQTVKLSITSAQIEFKASISQLTLQADSLRQQRREAQQALAELDLTLTDFTDDQSVNKKLRAIGDLLEFDHRKNLFDYRTNGLQTLEELRKTHEEAFHLTMAHSQELICKVLDTLLEKEATLSRQQFQLEPADLALDIQKLIQCKDAVCTRVHQIYQSYSNLKRLEGSVPDEQVEIMFARAVENEKCSRLCEQLQWEVKNLQLREALRRQQIEQLQAENMQLKEGGNKENVNYSNKKNEESERELQRVRAEAQRMDIEQKLTLVDLSNAQLYVVQLQQQNHSLKDHLQSVISLIHNFKVEYLPNIKVDILSLQEKLKCQFDHLPSELMPGWLAELRMKAEREEELRCLIAQFLDIEEKQAEQFLRNADNPWQIKLDDAKHEIQELKKKYRKLKHSQLNLRDKLNQLLDMNKKDQQKQEQKVTVDVGVDSRQQALSIQDYHILKQYKAMHDDTIAKLHILQSTYDEARTSLHSMEEQFQQLCREKVRLEKEMLQKKEAYESVRKEMMVVKMRTRGRDKQNRVSGKQIDKLQKRIVLQQNKIGFLQNQLEFLRKQNSLTVAHYLNTVNNKDTLLHALHVQQTHLKASLIQKVQKERQTAQKGVKDMEVKINKLREDYQAIGQQVDCHPANILIGLE